MNKPVFILAGLLWALPTALSAQPEVKETAASQSERDSHVRLTDNYRILLHRCQRGDYRDDCRRDVSPVMRGGVKAPSFGASQVVCVVRYYSIDGRPICD
jgi:hypothetical protein